MRIRRIESAFLAFVLSLFAAAALSQLPDAQPKTVTYSISFSGQGSAHVVSEPQGIDCPGTCTYTFPSNPRQQFLLTTTTAPGICSNMDCTGTAPHGPGQTATCNLGPMYGGNIQVKILLWADNGHHCSNAPGPQPDAIP
jgi:hypothetical protein